MANVTPKTLRNHVIYQIYVRNHGENGTFMDVAADLQRIKKMGVDIVYFMPIHPIGQLNKKGSLGCPYSITDYRAVNPEYGSLDDFLNLINHIHNLDMKVMIDIVFNHTAHDAVYIKDHPDWYHQDENGQPYTTVPDWSDVIDLKQPNPELEQYLVETIAWWVEKGVDGFRCDVASLLPVSFWNKARAAASKINPDVIWLAESVHNEFIRYRRDIGLPTVSDSELYEAFDMLYDYDIHPIYSKAVDQKIPVGKYLEAVRYQDGMFPENYIKMRCVENHDQPRIIKLAGSERAAKAWTALIAFLRGPFFIYAGQESAEDHKPSLFDIDKVKWGDYKLQLFITKLSLLKKHEAMKNGLFSFQQDVPLVQASWFFPEKSLFGLFNLSAFSEKIKVDIPDGTYHCLINDRELQVVNGLISPPEEAAVFEVSLLDKPEEMVYESE